MLSGSPAARARQRAIRLDDAHAALRLTADEAAILLDLQSANYTIGRGQELISEGRRCTNIFLLVEGIAIRYRVLRDGQRQILSLLLPGDFAGARSCFFENALYSVRTLTLAVVAPVPLTRFNALFNTHPRLMAKLFWSFSCESTMYAERLVGVARRSATKRVAHFLLELLTRLRALGLADERSYSLPLTQELISDALGLTVPYVNRVLQQLRSDGLVTIKEKKVFIKDIEELSLLADFEPTYLKPVSIAEFAMERAVPLPAEARA